jgi:hypothetical protein
MDENETPATDLAPEPSATETMINAWHREHFAGVPVELWNISAVAVADLKKRLAET